MNKTITLLLVSLAFNAIAKNSDIGKWDPYMAENTAIVTNGTKWIDGKCLPLEGKAFLNTAKFYDRLPNTISTNVNGGVRSLLHHTSGMQFRFRTDSKKLSFKWIPFSEDLEMDHMPSTGVSGIDIYRFDPSRNRWLYVKTGRIWNAKKGGFVSIDWRPGDACLVNLPLYNGIKTFSLGIDPKAKIEALGPRKSGIDKPVVFYGTSITHGGCCSRPGLSFVNIIGRNLDVPVVNLGFSGSGQGELEMSDYVAQIDASCYVIDSVWNMAPKHMQERYEPFIRNLRAKRPNTPIILAEGCDVYCGTNPTFEIVKRNIYVKPVYDKLMKEGWKKLYFLPSKGQLPDDFEGTVDGVHMNDWGMMHAAKAFGAAIQTALQ